MKKIENIELAYSVVRHDAEDCLVGVETTARVQPDSPTSGVGGSFWGKTNEKWPRGVSGEPLFPWLYVSCLDLPRRSGPFHLAQAIAFYLSEENATSDEISAEDLSSLVVRTYSREDRLVPLERPRELLGHGWRRVEWEVRQDYPSLGKYKDLFSPDVYAALCEVKASSQENLSGIKIGGWPTPIQRRQAYPGSCDIQIDATENYSYLDSGIAYLSKMGDVWSAQFECL